MKAIFTCLVLALLAGNLFAGSITELEAYQKMKEYQELYDEAYEDGDYDSALEYAQEVRRYAEDVQAYLNEMNRAPEPEPEPEPVVEAEPEPEPEVTEFTYQVVKGDNLWDIASKANIFGDPWKWVIIYRYNKQVLVDPDNPDLIHPGMIFQFPITEEAE